MNAAQRRSEVPHQVAEWQCERRPPANQHVIVAGAKRRVRCKPYGLAQAAPHAVAHDRIADLLRHRKTDADSIPVAAGLVAFARLQDERLAGRPRARGGCPKIRSAFQPLHGMLWSDFVIDLVTNRFETRTDFRHG